LVTVVDISVTATFERQVDERHSESLHNIIRMDNSLKILVTVGVVRLNKDFVSGNVQMGGK
jgi:hypothetical protein